MSGRKERRLELLLRVLLRVYPASFRESVGDDLVATMVSRWREVTGGGIGGHARFWLGEVPRFVLDGGLERSRAVRWPVARAGVEEIARALRSVHRSFSFHALAIAAIALGIGAATTMLAVTDAVVFRGLPYDRAGDLYLIWARFGELTFDSNSLPNAEAARAAVRSLEWIEGVHAWSPALTRAGEPVRANALDVTSGYLSGLGARATAGRLFSDGDFAAGAARVAVISHRLWQRLWGGDPGVVGREIRLDGAPHLVIGVMAGSWGDPEPIEAGSSTDVWLPVRADSSRTGWDFQLIGRASPGVDLAVLRRELSATGRRLSEEDPENRIDGAMLELEPVSLKERTIRGARGPLLLMLGAVGLLLLLTCANVANLYLSRGMARGSELSVRAALGASRWRLIRQLFSEALVTTGLGGTAGVIAGLIGLRAFVALAPAEIPRLREAAIDVRVLVLVLVCVTATGIVSGLLPAIHSSRGPAGEAGTRVTPGRARMRAQSAIVSVEIALALVLVIGSGLLLRSFATMLRVDPGFDPTDLTVAEIRPPGGREPAAQQQFFDEVLDRARSLPGVLNAAMIYTPPSLSGGLATRATANDAVGTSDPPFVRLTSAIGDPVEVLRMRLVSGRSFDESVRATDPLVVVLNEAAAKQIFPGIVDPVGRELRFGVAGSDAPLREVIGLVEDVTQRGRGMEREAQVYTPASQGPAFRYALTLRMRPGAPAPAAMIRSIVADVGGVPVDRIATMPELLSERDAEARFMTVLLTVFALLSLALAAVGTYGTASFAVAQRTGEIRIRMVLGAAGRRILGSLLRRAALIACTGLFAGTVAALVLSRFLERFVFGISTHDPLAFTAAIGVIGMAAVIASLVPAVRAARLDPNRVLRAGG
jgi:putative ABC transport system permease protein